MAGLPQTVSADEFESFRVRQRRWWFAAFLFMAVVAAAAGYGLTAAGVMAVGVLVAVVFALGGYELLRRCNRRSWLRRFPELAGLSYPWRVDARSLGMPERVQ